MDDLHTLPKKMFELSYKDKKKTNGKLIVKEYPTASVMLGYRSLIKELALNVVSNQTLFLLTIEYVHHQV